MFHTLLASPIGVIRFWALAGVILIGSVSYLVNRHRHRHLSDDERDQEIELYFEKDQEGLYPWETDLDDSPDRIEKGAKRYILKDGPKRGRW